ncbi:hypothetical protein PLICRDRAFT_412005 [Plicaturopsis crispa FD-325 SS-3]|nr:hypothetical protein PLICRDRAFT_412005 [Plicaturopsis crispa FD-325 SS-3]
MRCRVDNGNITRDSLVQKWAKSTKRVHCLHVLIRHRDLHSLLHNCAFAPLKLFSLNHLFPCRSHLEQAMARLTDADTIEPKNRQEKEPQLPDVALGRSGRVVHTWSRLNARLGARVNRRAPVSQLPNEILGEIFLHYCSEDGALESYIPALDVSQVSCHWREVALAYPRLWSTIAINERRCNPCMVGLFLERSRTSLLHIQCDGSEPASVFLQLIAHIERWSSFVALSDLRPNLELLAKTYAPMLRDLDIHVWWADIFSPESVESTHIFTLGAPLLADAKFDGVFMPSVPFESVERLEIKVKITVPFLQEILAAATSLQELTIDHDIIPYPEDRNEEFYIGASPLKELTVLQLSVDADPDPDLFWHISRALHLPALEKLELGCSFNSQVTVLADALESHYTKSIWCPHLRALALSEEPCWATIGYDGHHHLSDEEVAVHSTSTGDAGEMWPRLHCMEITVLLRPTDSIEVLQFTFKYIDIEARADS